MVWHVFFTTHTYLKKKSFIRSALVCMSFFVTEPKILYNIFILQACAACLENYFSQIDSLRSATIFVPRNFLLFIAMRNNIIWRCRSDIIIKLTKTKKEWWNVMKMIPFLLYVVITLWITEQQPPRYNVLHNLGV